MSESVAPVLRRPVALAACIAIAWTAIYGTRAALGHLSLGTSGYDLSVFDYALWSAGHGRFGDVPFLQHSLWTQHAMPTLALLLPAYAVWPSPWLLICAQLLAGVGAAWLLYRLLPADLPAVAVAALLVAFLFSRRSHAAFVHFYYVESLEPLLVFAMLLLWRARRPALAGVAAALALGCKEDMAIYLAPFGAYLYFRERERRGLLLMTACALWLAFCVLITIPAARRAYGFDDANPFFTALQSSAVTAVGARVAPALSYRVVAAVVTVTAATGFLCWLAADVFAIALPGLILSIVANPHTTAVGITDHYLYPVLPWLFYAAGLGAARLHRVSPAWFGAVSLLLLAGTIADSPIWAHGGLAGVSPDARAVVAQLAAIPPDAPVQAMPNLVPHLPHRTRITTIINAEEDRTARYIALTVVGDTWPLDDAAIESLVVRYRSDGRFEQLSNGPAYIFRRR